MKQKVLIIWSLLLGLCLAGCSYETQEEHIVTPIPTSTPEITEVPIKEYKTKEWIDLKAESENFGKIMVNQVEKVLINDWSNTKAVQNGINYSFSVNITFNFKSVSEKFSDLVVDCIPEIYDVDGNLISSTCSVGWTGFPQSAELFSENAEQIIEVGVQPEERVTSKCYLVLNFKSKEKTFNSITFKPSVLKNAKRGPKLLSRNDTAKITSINGAKIHYRVAGATYEIHETADNEVKKFFDFKYRIAAMRRPTNSRFVQNITTYEGKSALTGSVVIGLETVNSSKILYNADKTAERLIYSDSSEKERYVSSVIPIPFGRMYDVWTNRPASNDDAYRPTYIRLRFEFPEESTVRSKKEMLKFNGRYLVYQIKVTDRVLKKKK